MLSMVDEQGKSQNGFLRASDIFNLKVPVELSWSVRGDHRGLSDQFSSLVIRNRDVIVAVSETTDSLMSRGPANAAVTVELFADLASPVSRPALSVLN